MCEYCEKKANYKTRLYRVWCGMKERCYRVNHPAYKNYGGRGIAICLKWRYDFNAFKKWALENGYDENASKGQCTLDRIDNDGDYTPQNCKFSNAEEQTNNRRTNHKFFLNGEKLTISQASRKYGIGKTTIRFRLSKGLKGKYLIAKPHKGKRLCGRKLTEAHDAEEV